MTGSTDPAQEAALQIAEKVMLNLRIAVVAFVSPPGAGRSEVIPELVKLLGESYRALPIAPRSFKREARTLNRQGGERVKPVDLAYRQMQDTVSAGGLAIWGQSLLMAEDRAGLLAHAPGPALVAKLTLPRDIAAARYARREGRARPEWFERMYRVCESIKPETLQADGFVSVVVVEMAWPG